MNKLLISAAVAVAVAQQLPVRCPCQICSVCVCVFIASVILVSSRYNLYIYFVLRPILSHTSHCIWNCNRMFARILLLLTNFWILLVAVVHIYIYTLFLLHLVSFHRTVVVFAPWIRVVRRVKKVRVIVVDPIWLTVKLVNLLAKQLIYAKVKILM